MENEIRVLIVEDNAALTENLFEFLGEDRHALDFAADGLTALHLIASNDYDVIVLDIMLPGVSGFQICKRIRDDLRCTTPIIFMTAKDDIDDKITGFATGGDDYLVKPFNLRELALRIEALYRRRCPRDNMLRAAEIEFDPGTLQVHVGNHPGLELSGTTARIFEMLIRSYPSLVTYEQLQDHLWDPDQVDMNTLRTHVYTLRKKLREAFGIPLVKTLHGRGYRLVPQDEN